MQKLLLLFFGFVTQNEKTSFRLFVFFLLIRKILETDLDWIVIQY